MHERHERRAPPSRRAHICRKGARRLQRGKMVDASSRSSAAVLVVVVAVLGCASCVSGHAFLSYPNSRGALTGCGGGYKYEPIAVGKCQTNYCCQCGNAAFLQKRMAGTQWTPYAPMDRTTPMRQGFGMCGDGEDSQNSPNMKRGFFCNDCEGMPAVTGLRPGDTIDIQMQSTAHHQGFIEIFLCDTTACGGDISRSCFEMNQCVALERVHVDQCEKGYGSKCAPIDPEYPSRWYMPCPEHPFEWEGTSQMIEDQTMGGPDGTMRYRIPHDFNCGKSCVLQTYWATANTCAPPGHNEFFERVYSEGKLQQWWGCPGDGKTFGGFSRDHDTCGSPGTFPEEFWNCADIHMAGERFNNHDYTGYYANGNKGQKKKPSSYSAPVQEPAYQGQAFKPALASNSYKSHGVQQKCHKAGERCKGEDGYPYVEYLGCCSGYCNVRKSGEWGSFCPSDSYGDDCMSCLKSGKERACNCPHPRDYNGKKWFVTGATKYDRGEGQFQICLKSDNKCQWCYENTHGAHHRCDQYR